MKKNHLFYGLALVALLFTSCESDDNGNNDGGGVTSGKGCYVVNTGNWGGNDASVQYYDFTTGLATAGDSEANIFALQNGSLLGDLAQDMLWIKDRLFITLSGSQKLEVLDENGKRIRDPYMFTQEGASPRMLATDGNNVYMTNYDGNVYVYDAVTADFIKKIPVGVRPEGISYIDGYLVVNNSGDLYAYNGTVQMIDLHNGESITRELVNPYTSSVLCNGEVYIIDSGNYSDIPSAVYRISPDGDVCESLGFAASALAAYENTLYYVNNAWSYEVNGYVTSPLYALDVVTGERSEVLDAETMKNVNSLSVNPDNGDIFVGYAEYGVLGTMKVFAIDGTQKGEFEVGYYTAGARFEYK